VTSINPLRRAEKAIPPEEFGDNWADRLDDSDVKVIHSYFERRERVWTSYGWINFRIGGRDNRIDMAGDRKVGITFELPRNSLMAAIKFEVFDDLLIGNFMKTTLHGSPSLYPDFTPYVAKYADNGRAYSLADIKKYMGEYRRRSPAEFILHRFENRTESMMRRFVVRDSYLFNLAKRGYLLLHQPK
jgi:hypothetical protein